MQVKPKPAFVTVSRSELVQRKSFEKHFGYVIRLQLGGNWADVVLGIVTAHRERISGLSNWRIGRVFFTSEYHARDKMRAIGKRKKGFSFSGALAREIVADSDAQSTLLKQGIFFFWQEIEVAKGRYIIRDVENNTELALSREDLKTAHYPIVAVRILRPAAPML